MIQNPLFKQKPSRFGVPSFMGEEEPEQRPGMQDQFMGPQELTSVAPQPKGMQPIEDSKSEASKYFDEIMNLRANPGPFTTGYKQMLQQAPEPKDYEPSTGRRIGAIAAGIAGGLGGGAQGSVLADSIIQNPYRQAGQEYSDKLGLQAAGARQEQAEADDTVKALSEARAMGLRYDEYGLKKEELRRKFEHDDATAKINADRAKAYIQKMGQPDYDYTPQEDGSLMAINKHDPTDRYMVPAKTVAAATLGVARQNAGTNARNANTNEYRAETDRANTDSLIKYRGEVLKIRDKQGKIVQPTQQSSAIQTALGLLQADNRFKEFVQPEGTSGFLKMSVDDNSPLYREFIKALKDKAEAVIKGNPFSTTDPGTEEPEIIWLDKDGKPRKPGGF